jgi:transcriptional regulator with XRE-family HTH domain
MPRRRRPDPLALAVGNRVRQLREEAGLTQEKLAYESDFGSKGYLSGLEKGLVLPSLTKLQLVADHLGVELFDLFVVPERAPRHELVDRSRAAAVGTVRRLLRELEARPRKER